MIFKIKHKFGSTVGMTVLETLMAMFILAMVTSVVATGIPTAANAYNKVLDSANAQLVLSTAMIKIRDELETADELVLTDENKTVTYKTVNNGRSRIYLNTDTPKEKYGHEGVARLWQYMDPVIDNNLDGSIADKKNRLLVSQKASNDNLYLTYTSISFTANSKYVTFKDLVVKKINDDQILAGPLDYSVKLLRKY